MMNRSFENLDNLLEHLGSVYNYNQFYFVLIFISLTFFEDDTFDSVDSKYMCTKWAHSPAIFHHGVEKSGERLGSSFSLDAQKIMWQKRLVNLLGTPRNRWLIDG